MWHVHRSFYMLFLCSNYILSCAKAVMLEIYTDLISAAISQDLSIDIVRGRTSTQTSSELHIDTIESAKQHRNAQNSSPEESNWISTASLPAYPWELSPETEGNQYTSLDSETLLKKCHDYHAKPCFPYYGYLLMLLFQKYPLYCCKQRTIMLDSASYV